MTRAAYNAVPEAWGHTTPPPSAYGMQAVEQWAPGELKQRPLLTLEPNGRLWRIAVTGDLLVKVEWGTAGRRILEDLAGPVIADLAGFVNVYARPRTANGAVGQAIATCVDSAGESQLRRFFDSATALPEDAVSFVCLAAAQVSVRGVAVNLQPLERIDLVAGSSLVSGSGLVAFLP